MSLSIHCDLDSSVNSIADALSNDHPQTMLFYHKKHKENTSLHSLNNTDKKVLSKVECVGLPHKHSLSLSFDEVHRQMSQERKISFEFLWVSNKIEV